MTGWPPGLELRDPRLAGAILAVLGLLFLGRIVGQLLVVTRAPSWLPPMQEWYSGALPYRALLATQACVVVAVAATSAALLLEVPVATTRRPDLGGALLWLGWLYLLSMVVRYVVRMARHPEARWFGRTIPIFFHMVLATCVLVVGSYLRG